MPNNATVPLHTSGKPCVSDTQITETDHIVCIENIFLILLVKEFPKPGAERRQKFGVKMLIFQNSYGDFLLGFLRIGVLLGIGIRSFAVAVVDKQPLKIIDDRFRLMRRLDCER